MKVSLSLISLFIIMFISAYNVFTRSLPSTQVSAFMVMVFTLTGILSLYIGYKRKRKDQ
ncbi:hypothetical protein GCM10011389_16580 [Pontibacillus salipaludis]|uniref:Uncharacterized protein n=1 Tax=Pontibacillus salipaludis TaxID=1697394 RepID=A0ABQ1Q1H1_9BACI|nr:hypothetical protein GCM10011389_16580 [Pontibacillus salipaludis]